MRTSFILHFDMMPTVDLLSNAELGKVIKAVYHYNVNGELPEKLSTSSSILFQQIKAALRGGESEAGPGSTGKEREGGPG